MTRSDLIAAVARTNSALPAKHAREVVDLFFDEISRQVASGDRVELRGFGIFSAVERQPKIGRNPKNGAEVIIPAKQVIQFKASKPLRSRLNEGLPEQQDPAILAAE